jgi:hypothetical protein
MEEILEKIEALVAKWQEALGNSAQVILGGSLISGLFILDEETEIIDVDVRFLSVDPENEILRKKIETVTGLKYRKTITVNDWPSGESKGIMVEGRLVLTGVGLPLDIEGCIRNPKYVGWARFYTAVLTLQEIEDIRNKKIILRHNKSEYKKFKSEIRKEVERRCIAANLVEIENKNGVNNE